MIKLTKKTRTAILQHAEAAAPNESCGFVVMQGQKQIYRPCDNVAARPSESFEIDARDWLLAANDGCEIVAVVHSHPEGGRYLSADDRRFHAGGDLPWLLVADGEVYLYKPVPRLRGRVFEYGVADCSALLLDAYHLAGIDMPDHARTDIDADAAAGYLLAHAAAVGLVQVFDDLQPGDVLLTSHRGQVSHVALYIGNGEILHHAYDQLSRREPYGAYWRNQTHSVWRHPQWRAEMLQAILNDLDWAL